MVFLSAGEIRRLRTMYKPVRWDWQALLLAECSDADTQCRRRILTLDTGTVRGELHVYARRGSNQDDFSTGLLLFDLDGEAIPIVRFNGPHPNAHVNRFPVRHTVPVTPHVHYLTEHYEREARMNPKIHPNAYALCTTAYGDLAGAIAVLGRRANIQLEPVQLPFVTGRVLP